MITRRNFLLASSLVAPGLCSAEAERLQAIERNVLELGFRSGKTYNDHFNDLELGVIFADERGREQTVPAYWAGENTWRVRYAPPAPGRYRYRTVSTDTANRDLHGRTGVLEVAPYGGNHPLYRHGDLRVSANKRYLEHADGTPFFWLGDTWWLGLAKRLRWPEGFQRLTLDRVQKGFSVIQIVAGLFPDMDSFDQRGTNEAGFPWEPGYERINPAFFDMADLRVQYLVDRGLVPCVLGCWGYYLPKLGARRMKQHWRYLVARWGAYPVVWCMAGEGTMPYYLSQTRQEDTAAQRTGWTEIARYVRSVDPYRRLITVHPSRTARDSVDDPAVLDFDMLQTGHSDRKSIPNTIRTVQAQRDTTPTMPVINGEVCYESILEACREEMQRFMFWSCMLSGAAGFTYGANGVWQVNTAEEPFGPSPHGRTWGNVPWDQASQLPGSRQLGLAAALLKNYEWWRFEPHPEWVDPHWTTENYEQPYAAGIPGEVRVVFIPLPGNPPTIMHLESGVRYRGFLFDPSTAERHDVGTIQPEAGRWKMPIPPAMRDWVLVLEKS